MITSTSVELSYLPVSVGLGVVWWLTLAAFHTYRQRFLGSGTDEYRRVFQATFLVFSVLGIASYLLKVQVARGSFLTVLPVGLIGIFLWRWGGASDWSICIGVGCSATGWSS